MLTIYRRLLDLLDGKERRRFWLLLGMIFTMALFELAGVASIMPFLAVLSNPEIVETNALINYVYEGLGFTSTSQFLPFLGLAIFATILTGQLFKTATMYAVHRFCKLWEYGISSRLLAAYLHQPYSWFLARHSGELGKTVLSEVERVTAELQLPALRLLAYAVIVIMLVLFLLVAEPAAAIGGTVIVVGGYLTVFVFTRRYLDRIGDDRMRANGERFIIAQEALGGIKDVKVLGLEENFINRFRQPARRFAMHQAAANIVAEVPRYLLEAIVFGAMMAFLIILLFTTDGQIEQILPTIGVFALAGARIFAAMQQIYRSATNIRFTRPALEALAADFEARTATAAPTVQSRTEVLRLNDRLELVDLEYRYPGAERSALVGLDLVIQANTTVGLVGASGAGKTTLVDVLLGLLMPQRGEIVVDGRQIDSANLRAWQRNLGYVPQHIFLTDDTIAANIAFGVERDKIDMAAVERAARTAELHDFVITELPLGYDTSVGERGVRLSGGQRQRIGIARGLYHNPDVLILDEATSALDNLTERAVMDAVHNLGHAKTIIMIAHRLTTVRHCDTIFMLEHGRCTAAADYDTLLKQHEGFRKLAVATAS